MTTELSWTGTFRGNIGRLLVPASESQPFKTDLASVPRVMTWLFPRYGQYSKAAVLHDYLCQTVGQETIAVYPTREGGDDAGHGSGETQEQLIRVADRSDADEIFRLVMTELGVPWARRWLMWSAVSWATLLTSLWPGRSSKAALRMTGRVIVVAGALAVLALVALLWPGGIGSVLFVVGGATALAAVVMLAGYVALGRWDRWLVYLAAFGMTVASIPLIVVGAVIAVMLALYLLFEDAFSGFRATRARVRRLWSRPPTAEATPRDERIEAVRES
ncbi:MAG: DUF1353 domain-containing protein [Acidimicrobiia bacterium]